MIFAITFQVPLKGVAMHRRSLALIATLFLTGCGLMPLSQAAPQTLSASSVRHGAQDAWKDEVIYFALLDRFNNGDSHNDAHVDLKNPTAYHGGDMQGLIDKLDYLNDLGITTIWLSPILDNDDAQLASTGMWGYHGYWTKDFSQLDEHLGSIEKAQELVTKAHAKGIKVLLDIIANQAGYSFPSSAPPYKGWFHTNGDIQDWENQWWVENGSLCGLPDFAQENPAVSSFLISTYQTWAERLNLDGFRIDTVKHVPKSFWSMFNNAIHTKQGAKFLCLGEVLNGDPNYVQDYLRQGKFDSVFDFPLYYTLNEVFAKGASIKKLGERFDQDALYPDAGMLSPFLDNHDVPRFLSQAGGDETKLRLALACLLTIRGMPMLYYGTEVALGGGAEPDNRRDMAWGSNEPMRQYTQKLIRIRKRSTALSHGRQLEMWRDDSLYAYLRQSTDAEAIVVLNNGTVSQSRTIELRSESRLADGTTLVDQLTGESVTVSGHRFTTKLAGKQARIFLPADKKQK